MLGYGGWLLHSVRLRCFNWEVYNVYALYLYCFCTTDLLFWKEITDNNNSLYMYPNLLLSFSLSRSSMFVRCIYENQKVFELHTIFHHICFKRISLAVSKKIFMYILIINNPVSVWVVSTLSVHILLCFEYPD